MTARQMWEGLLTEVSKTGAPSMLLEDFNYFLNKAVNQYVNKRYNIYDLNQQTTDDLRVLKSTAKIPVTKDNKIVDDFDFDDTINVQEDASYEIYLPLDYLHMLNCVCYFRVNERYKCYNPNTVVKFKATRLTSDMWSNVINDYYNRPLPQRPYYYIHNENTSLDLPTNPISDTSKALTRTTVGTDSNANYINSSYDITYVTKYNDGSKDVNGGMTSNYEVSKFTKDHPTWKILETVIAHNGTSNGESNLPRSISINKITNKSLVEKEAGVRYGNPSSIRCEIRYGEDASVFELIGVKIDYIKTPQYIRLTQEQVNLTRDTSQILEFPDVVCDQIINELVKLVMDNTADPRLATHPQVTQSIADPTAQGQQQPQAQTSQQRRQA